MGQDSVRTVIPQNLASVLQRSSHSARQQRCKQAQGIESITHYIS